MAKDIAGLPPKTRPKRSKAGVGAVKRGADYRWIDKDPMIDRLMAEFRDSDFTYETLAWASGTSATTLRNWDYGKTKRPQHASLARVAYALGIEFGVHKLGTLDKEFRSPATDHYAAEIKTWQRTKTKGGD